MGLEVFKSFDNLTQFGMKCAKWRIGDTEEWCFVGFDSNCSDRAAYNIRPRQEGEFTSIHEVSQFMSNVPCLDQQGVYLKAHHQCRVWRNTWIILNVPIV